MSLSHTLTRLEQERQHEGRPQQYQGGNPQGLDRHHLVGPRHPGEDRRAGQQQSDGDGNTQFVGQDVGHQLQHLPEAVAPGPSPP